MKRLLVILPLAILLVAPNANAWWFDKYPSRYEAKNECEKWRPKGGKETYKAWVTISKEEVDKLLVRARREYRDSIKRIEEEERINPKPIHPLLDTQDYITNTNRIDSRKLARDTLRAEEFKMERLKEYKTIERLVRTCLEEKETKQFIVQEKSKGDRLVKRFKW